MSAPDNIWVIGDIQGCAGALRALLAKPELSGTGTQFWFAGDLVNRGPDSLGALRLIRSLGDRARVVLGNHDLHLLGVAAGAREPAKSDTLQDVLAAPDADELLSWLRHRPLMVREHGYVMVHAGILPAWTLDQAQSLSAEVETILQGPDWQKAMHKIYGKKPVVWDETLHGKKRMRLIINAFTRMRMCHPDGRLDFDQKGEPDRSTGLLPWFEVPGRRDPSEPVIFGHWSALGLMIRPDTICLDTGCVWGRALTALRLGDHACVQQSCMHCR